MTTIIGFAGVKQSGKNTACNYIKMLSLVDNGVSQKVRMNKQGKIEVSDVFGQAIPDHDYFLFENGEVDGYQIDIRPVLEQLPVKEYSFAEKLKDICIGVLGLTHEQCYGTDEQKNELTNLKWEDMPGLNKSWKSFADTADPKFMSAREVLQYVGTNIFRRMYSECWVDCLLKKINAIKPEVALISDVRFPNECDAILNAGGFAIRLLRGQKKDSHDSETALDDYKKFSAVIDNRTMSIPEQNEAIYNTLQPLNILPTFS